MDSAPVPDIRGQDAAKVLPWVSTLAGSDCAGEFKEGKLLESRIGPSYLFISSNKTIYFACYGVVWSIKGDMVHIVAKRGYVSDDGPVGQAGIGGINGLAALPDGSIYFAETTRLRLIKDGQVTTIAGSAKEAGQVDGPGLQARFMYIRAMTLEPDGGLLVGDRWKIRRYKDGQVTTLAGGDKPTYPQDGPVSSATISQVYSLVSVGTRVYFADSYVIRAMESTQITTMAGQYMSRGGIAGGMKDGPASEALFSERLPSMTSYQGALYVADRLNNRIRKLEKVQVSSLNSGKKGLKDGPLSTALFEDILSVVADEKGNLLVGDAGNCRIRYIELH